MIEQVLVRGINFEDEFNCDCTGCCFKDKELGCNCPRDKMYACIDEPDKIWVEIDTEALE